MSRHPPTPVPDDKRVARAPPTSRISCEDAAPDKIADIAERGVLRALGKLCPFGRCELALEPVRQPFNHRALPRVERRIRVLLPEPRFRQHSAEDLIGVANRPIEAPEEPSEPRRDVEIAPLRRLQPFVIRAPLTADLRGHAVEAPNQTTKRRHHARRRFRFVMERKTPCAINLHPVGVRCVLTNRSLPP